MLKFSEIFECSKENFRIIPILKEFEWFEWFEWFGSSPTEPFNQALFAAWNPEVCRLEALLAAAQNEAAKAGIRRQPRGGAR